MFGQNEILVSFRKEIDSSASERVNRRWVTPTQSEIRSPIFRPSGSGLEDALGLMVHTSWYYNYGRTKLRGAHIDSGEMGSRNLRDFIAFSPFFERAMHCSTFRNFSYWLLLCFEREFSFYFLANILLAGSRGGCVIIMWFGHASAFAHIIWRFIKWLYSKLIPIVIWLLLQRYIWDLNRQLQWSCRNDSEQIPKAIMTQAEEQRKQDFWGAMWVSSAGALGSEHYVQNSV